MSEGRGGFETASNVVIPAEAFTSESRRALDAPCRGRLIKSGVTQLVSFIAGLITLTGIQGGNESARLTTDD